MHYDLVEEKLRALGYDEPCVHFDETEWPDFLLPGVKEYLGLPV